jgi:putative FmdB family regulatory protein
VPTYDYRCKKCAHEFAIVQSIKAEPLRQCPKCRGKVERLITGGANFILRGNGFYSTDYRSSDYKKAVEKDKKSADAANKPAPTAKKPAPESKKRPATEAAG